MSREVDDVVRKPARAAEMSTTTHTEKHGDKNSPHLHRDTEKHITGSKINAGQGSFWLNWYHSFAQ